MTPDLILILSSLLLGLGGIILLILGLTQKSKARIIAGSIMFAVAIGLGIAGAVITLGKAVEKVEDNIENIEKKVINKTMEYFEDSASQRKVDTTYSEAISGFIEESDNSKTYLKVYPKRELFSFGISLEKVDRGKRSKEFPKAIQLTLSFERSFKGIMILSLFDQNKKLIGKSETRVSKISGDMAKINFGYSKETDFAAVDFGTLTFPE